MTERPLYIGPIPAEATRFNHAQRRVLARQARREARNSERIRPLTVADIPPGSLMSDASLEAIAAGQYELVRDRPNPNRPTRQERARQSRRDKARALTK